MCERKECPGIHAMSDGELQTLNDIISALEDIRDAVVSGRRNRDFACGDLEDEANNLRNLATELSA